MGTGEPSRAAAQWARGLTGGQLDAIAALERRVVDHDGARLKLEWGHLRSRAGERPEDLLWCEDGRLLGFLGLYRFGGTTVELAGMVDPDARRRGIGTALLDAALAECRVRGHAQARVCRGLMADGVHRVSLEVAVDNDRALGLYTSLGFEPVATEDYHELPLR